MQDEVIEQKATLVQEPLGEKTKMKLHYKIIGTMASEGCPNCIDVIVGKNISNEEITGIFQELISMKGTKKLMVDSFTSKSDYTNHKDNGPYFANYMSFDEGDRTSHTTMFHDGSETEL